MQLSQDDFNKLASLLKFSVKKETSNTQKFDIADIHENNQRMHDNTREEVVLDLMHLDCNFNKDLRQAVNSSFDKLKADRPCSDKIAHAICFWYAIRFSDLIDKIFEIFKCENIGTQHKVKTILTPYWQYDDSTQETQNDDDWDRANHQWVLQNTSNKVCDSEFAAIGIDVAQNTNASEPLPFVIDVYANLAFDHETQISVGFETFKIIIDPIEKNGSFYHQTNAKADVANNGQIEAKGAKGNKHYLLTSKDGKLAGNYTSRDETLCSLYSEDREFSFKTTLKVDKSEANAVFPKNTEYPSNLKKALIERILVNEKFPLSKRQDSVELHTLIHKVVAKDSKTIESTKSH